jgi:hypothetical protein
VKIPAWAWWVIGGLGLLLVGGTAVMFSNRKDFAVKVMTALGEWTGRGGLKLPWVARLILLGQAAYETEWGTTAAAAGHNYWNLTAGASWKGAVIPGPDTEPDGQGGWKNITQAWRAYPDDNAAISDLVDNWLTWRAYAPARVALLEGDEPGYYAALSAGGYFTQDLATYTAGATARGDAAEALLPEGIS